MTWRIKILKRSKKMKFSCMQIWEKVIRKESYDFICFVGISNRFDIFD